MRGAWRALVPPLVLSLLLAGCTLPGESNDDAGDGSCEGRFGGELRPFVLLVPTLQDDPDVAMRRLAEVVGEWPEGAPVTQGATLVWRGANGTLLWTRGGDADARVAYTPDAPLADADAHALLEAALAAFQPPFDLVYTPDGLQALQSIGRSPIEGTGGAYANGTLTIGPLIQLDPNVALMDDAALQARALEVARCVDADATGTGGGPLSWRLRDTWLVRRIEVGGGPADCGAELYVDLHGVDGTLAPPILCGAQLDAEQGHAPV